MKNFAIEPIGPFSMDAIRELRCGFLQGTRTCGVDESSARIAFPVDRTFEVVGVDLRYDGHAIRGSVTGNAPTSVVKRQVAHALAVDHDGRGFQKVIDADSCLRRVGAEHPSFRPVVAYSPYVMAGWSVLSQRLRMSQAAAIQLRIAEEAGDVVELEGERVPSFPRPESLLRRDAFPGVAAEKWSRLQAVARAALEGKLEREKLLAMPFDDAYAQLMEIHGIGPWTADAILIRGCGPLDVLPLREPTLHAAVALTYGLRHVPSDDEVSTIAAQWKPFRTWVSVMLIARHFDAARALLQAAPSGAKARSGRRKRGSPLRRTNAA